MDITPACVDARATRITRVRGRPVLCTTCVAMSYSPSMQHARPVLASDSYLTARASIARQHKACNTEDADSHESSQQDSFSLSGQTLWGTYSGKCTKSWNTSQLGCDQHNAAFTCQVLVVARTHFFSRDVNRCLGGSQKVAVADKKARLL